MKRRCIYSVALLVMMSGCTSSEFVLSESAGNAQNDQTTRAVNGVSIPVQDGEGESPALAHFNTITDTIGTSPTASDERESNQEQIRLVQRIVYVTLIVLFVVTFAWLGG